MGGLRRGCLLRRWTAAFVVAALAATVPAAPPSEAQTGESCPAAPFADRESIPTAHRDNVDCAFAQGIAQGLADGRFGPTLPVRRDQAVSFLVRTLRAGDFGHRLPQSTDQGFADIGGNVHADAINIMSAIDVVHGTSDTTFDPAARISRAQLASLILRALAWAQETDIDELQSDTNRFVDVAPSDVHRRNINGAADLGLIMGVSADLFAPASHARRDQVVTLLFRLYEAFPDDGGGDGEPGPAFPADAAVYGIEVRADAVHLSWSPAEDPEAVVEYRVEQRIGEVSAAQNDVTRTVVATTDGLSVEVTGLLPRTTYTFRILAADEGGNLSEDGPTTTVTTLDTAPPLDLGLTLAPDRAFQNSLVDTRSSDGYASARGPDGTQYNLRVPQGALLSAEPIVMTPIVDADNLPGDGQLVAGVKLEPEGLLLREAAILQIVLPDDADRPAVGQEVPMAFEGDGEAVRLAGLDPAEETYVLEVPHFSGVVISEGGTAERQEVLQRARTRQSQLSGQIAEGMIRERRAALTGAEGDPDWTATHEALMRQIYEEAVAPLVEAAKTNDALVNEAVAAAMSWLRTMELLGMATPADRNAIFAAVEQILRHAYEQSKARCLPNADVRDGLRMLSIIRHLELMSLDSYPISEAQVCIDQQFDVDFSATTWHRNTSEIEDGLEEVSGSLTASVRVTPEEAQFHRPILFTGEVVPTASGIQVSPRPNVCNVHDVTLESEALFPVTVEPNLNPLRDTPGALLVHLSGTSFDDTLRAGLEYRRGFTSSDGGCTDVEGVRWAHFMSTDLSFAFDDLAFRVPVGGSISRSGSRVTQPCPTNCYPFVTSMELALTRVD